MLACRTANTLLSLPVDVPDIVNLPDMSDDPMGDTAEGCFCTANVWPIFAVLWRWRRVLLFFWFSNNIGSDFWGLLWYKLVWQVQFYWESTCITFKLALNILGRACLVCNMTSLWASGNSAPVNKQESFKRNIISISTGFSFQSSIKSQFVKLSILIQIAFFQCVKNIKSLLLCQTQHQRLHEHVVLFIRHPSA